MSQGRGTDRFILEQVGDFCDDRYIVRDLATVARLALPVMSLRTLACMAEDILEGCEDIANNGVEI